MKTLLIVSGGIEAIPGIKLARDMGLFVVVSDGNPNAPGFAFANDRIVASTYDVEGTLYSALQYSKERRPIDGVMCIASDVPLTVATIAEALGLAGISTASARLAMDKLAMKQKFHADRIPVPWFASVNSPEQLKHVIGAQGCPLVIKPVDSRGARGVLRLTREVDADWAFNEAKKHSPTGRVMIEKFLSGPQVSTESLMLDGVAYTPGFSDRNYEYLAKYAPHIIENGGDLPSCLPAEVQRAVRELVGRAAISMGIRNGVVKGDIVVCDGEPYVIELAARLSGGYFCTHEIPLNTGVDLVGNAIRVALGERPNAGDLAPRHQRCVCQRYLFPTPGRVISVRGHDKVTNWPGVELCEIRVKPGDLLRTVDDHPARAGVVIVTGETRAEAITLAEKAIESIEITVEQV